MAPEVVNNVLCYLSTARHENTEVIIVAACRSFYNCEEIVEAKEIFFKLFNKQVLKRRGDDKTKSDLTDILQLMRDNALASVHTPNFLANGYNKMPPSAGFEVIGYCRTCNKSDY